MKFSLGLDAVAKAIGSLVETTGQVIDEFHTSTEEKLQAKIRLYALANETIATLLTYQTKLAEYQARVIMTETTGHSWLQRNWRPITMLVFVAIIVYNHVLAPIFGLTPAPIPGNLWDVIKIGLGGYVIGRSAEKIAFKVLSEKGGKDGG